MPPPRIIDDPEVRAKLLAVAGSFTSLRELAGYAGVSFSALARTFRQANMGVEPYATFAREYWEARLVNKAARIHRLETEPDWRATAYLIDREDKLAPPSLEVQAMESLTHEETIQMLAQLPELREAVLQLSGARALSERNDDDE